MRCICSAIQSRHHSRSHGASSSSRGQISRSVMSSVKTQREAIGPPDRRKRTQFQSLRSKPVSVSAKRFAHICTVTCDEVTSRLICCFRYSLPSLPRSRQWFSALQHCLKQQQTTSVNACVCVQPSATKIEAWSTRWHVEQQSPTL